MLTIEPTGAVLGATVRGMKYFSHWETTVCCGFPISISTSVS
jgi:hypothetical protein